MTTNFQPKNALRYAGDVTIDRLVITTSRGVYQEISGQVLQIQIFEDLFSPFISGSLVLKDTLDLSNVLPFIGEEYLDLRISTPTLPTGQISGTFHVYKMTDKVKIGDRSTAYELNFISIEALIDMNKKNSKVYSGKISDIVPTFVTDKIEGMESKKKWIVEPTRNSIKYISNFWSPVKNLSYLADNAISQSQSPSFLFFENRDGFNFKSLENLYSGKVVQNFICDRYTRDTVPLGGNSLNINEDYKRIAEYDIPVAYDYMDRVRSGMMSSRLMSYDSTKKMYTARNYSANARFPVQKHLNDHALFSDKAPNRAASRMFIYPRAFETFTSFGDTTNARIVQERNSFLKMAEAQKLSIKVAGRTDYTVGQVVTVYMTKLQPVAQRDQQDELVDKINSGKYLIAAINHIITPVGHDCSMELIKDSSMKKINF
jgi:hypothetical protein